MHIQVATSGEAVGGSRYRTLGRLGAGGMAEVDLALQNGVAGSSRLCVLKRVRQDLVGRREYVSMFFEEARISASLSHPNIVQIYEVGGDEQDCFLALEFLRGRSYAHVLAVNSGKTLDYRVDLEVMLATLNGLEHAHQRRDLSGEPMRLVHRDISPPNVFVTYDGEIKVLDFGVAKTKNSLVQTEAGILKGKAEYMAPEVVAGEPFDARADLYAVGVMLWEATAGGERWPGMNDVAILKELARGGAVEAPGAVARGLPADADRICVKALAEDPNRRYQTAAELREDLLGLCAALGGRLGQSELKDYMQRHFAAERQREEREVEAALRGERAPSAVPSGEADQGGFTKRVKRSSDRPAAVAAATPQAPKRRNWSWLALAGVLAVVAVLAKLLTPAGAPSAAKGPETVAEKPVAAQAPSAGAPAVARTPTEAQPEPPSAAAAKPARPARERSAKPTSAARGPTPPATGDPKPAALRKLQLDREDPWH